MDGLLKNEEIRMFLLKSMKVGKKFSLIAILKPL